MYAHMYSHMTDEAEAKQKGLGKVKEGKSKMCPRLCEELGTFFHEEDMQETQYCNSQSWNLMCRHFNVDELHASHFGFAVDAMTIEHGKTEIQSSGGDTNMTSVLKHLHVNPFKPQVNVFYVTFTSPITFRHIYSHICADRGVKIFNTLLIDSLGDCRDFIDQDSFDW